MLTTPHATRKELSEDTLQLGAKIMEIFRKNAVEPITASAATLLALVTVVSLIQEHGSLDDAKTVANIAKETLTKLCAELDAATPPTMH